MIVRQRKAAVSFLAASVVLTAMVAITTGPALLWMYLHELSEVSNVLLVAFNNQSLAAEIATLRHPGVRLELFDWRIHQLSPLVKITSLLLSIGVAVLGGWLDRRLESSARERPVQVAWPPYGAVMCLVGATMFAPIAWSHYYIVLLLPVVLLLDRARQRHAPLYLGLALVIFLLNLYPVAYREIAHQFHAWSILRSQFDAGLLAILGMILLSAPAFLPDASGRKVPDGMLLPPDAGVRT